MPATDHALIFALWTPLMSVSGSHLYHHFIYSDAFSLNWMLSRSMAKGQSSTPEVAWPRFPLWWFTDSASHRSNTSTAPVELSPPWRLIHIECFTIFICFFVLPGNLNALKTCRISTRFWDRWMFYFCPGRFVQFFFFFLEEEGVQMTQVSHRNI